MYRWHKGTRHPHLLREIWCIENYHRYICLFSKWPLKGASALAETSCRIFTDWCLPTLLRTYLIWLIHLGSNKKSLCAQCTLALKHQRRGLVAIDNKNICFCITFSNTDEEKVIFLIHYPKQLRQTGDRIAQYTSRSSKKREKRVKTETKWGHLMNFKNWINNDWKLVLQTAF